MDTPDNQNPAQSLEGETFPSPTTTESTHLTAGRSRHVRRRYLLATFIIIIIISAAAFAYLSSQPHHIEPDNQGPPIGKLTTSTTLHRQISGLEETITITDGPYFLSELLSTTITLSNHSDTRYQVVGGCGYPVASVTLNTIRNNKHHITIAAMNSVMMSCPPPMPRNILPGQTLSETEYLPLTDDGQISIDISVRLSQGTVNQTQAQSSASQNNGTLSLPITVMPDVPSDRIITANEKDAAQITIDAPVEARNHLVAYNSASCADIGSMGVGKIMGWEQLTSTTLHNIGCSQHNEHWYYLVGTPGYNFIAGTLSSV